MEIKYNSAFLDSIAIHHVGNKNNEEDLSLSKKETDINDELATVLTNYTFSAFKFHELYHFHHESELELNEVFTYAGKIFADSDEVFEQSRNLAMHLYRQTMHPKIKAGEFYTLYYRDCEVDGKIVDAIGLFKSENRDSFFKVQEENETLQISLDSGINLKKPDKGCIIFNTKRDDGYILALVDNNSNGAEAMYWIDDFLSAQNLKDEYFQTQKAMTFCKNYVHDKIPEKYDVSKAEQADLLNKSIKYFKENEIFDVNMFADEVMQHPEIIEDFKQSKGNFEKENGLNISEQFEISDSAVKNQARYFKSIIKLDKNFHIYVHGKKEYIEKGFDSSNGLNYYKLFFENEE
jgi:hypothetical protein